MQDSTDVAVEQSFYMHPDEFKARLKALRMTQGEFADYIGTTIRTVNDWGSSHRKRGRGNPTGDQYRLGPPLHIVRLLKFMERANVPVAPPNPSASDATRALFPSVGAAIQAAIAKDWPHAVVGEAIMAIADEYHVPVPRTN